MRGYNQEDWSYFTLNQVSKNLSFPATQPEWEVIWVSGSHSLFVQPFLLWLSIWDADDRIAHNHDGVSLMLRERKRESPWKGTIFCPMDVRVITDVQINQERLECDVTGSSRTVIEQMCVSQYLGRCPRNRWPKDKLLLSHFTKLPGSLVS